MYMILETNKLSTTYLRLLDADASLQFTPISQSVSQSHLATEAKEGYPHLHLLHLGWASYHRLSVAITPFWLECNNVVM